MHSFLLCRSRIPILVALAASALVSPSRAATFELTTATVADINAAFAAGALTSEKLPSIWRRDAGSTGKTET